MARAIHPFPARMASDIALEAMRGAGMPLTVLDPMCGSGTVLAAGSRQGHSMIGFDLDPLAVLMSRVATSTTSTEELTWMAETCVAKARRSSPIESQWNDSETEPFAQYWFAPIQYQQLLRLSHQINRLEQSPERDALQIAMSRTIVTKTPQASLAADTAHSRPHRIKTESSYDVYEGFLRSARLLSRQLRLAPMGQEVRIYRRDAREARHYAQIEADLIITSPPYLNAIDYLRGHRLALIWLGHSITELRQLRAIAIGSEKKLQEPEAAQEHLALIADLLGAVGDPDELPFHLLARYTRDISMLAVNARVCLKPGGKGIFVVADSVLKGNLIPTGAIVERCLELAGLKLSNTSIREIPESFRYLPVTNAGRQLGKRMKHEYVITAERVMA